MTVLGIGSGGNSPHAPLIASRLLRFHVVPHELQIRLLLRMWKSFESHGSQILIAVIIFPSSDRYARMGMEMFLVNYSNFTIFFSLTTSRGRIILPSFAKATE